MNDQIIIFHRFHLSDSKAFVCPKTTRDTITPPTILSNSATVKDLPRQWPLKFLCWRTKIRRILVNEKTQPRHKRGWASACRQGREESLSKNETYPAPPPAAALRRLVRLRASTRGRRACQQLAGKKFPPRTPSIFARFGYCES